MKHFTDSPQQKKCLKASTKKVLWILVLSLIAVILVSLCFGSFALDFFGDEQTRRISLSVFCNLRLPRVLSAVLVGGILGTTGAICQTIFGNPLASPDITGVASGSSFGAAVAIILGFTGIARTGFAFIGGIIAIVLLLLFVRISQSSGADFKSKYLLAGILISSLASAGLMILKTIADPERELAAIEFWTMGSFASITLNKLVTMLAPSLVPLVLLFIFYRQALILSRGYEEALSVGVSPRLWQAIILVLVTTSVASVVSVVGVVGFIGLIVPHIALRIVHKRSRTFLFVCFIIGAILTVLSDLFARTIISGAELPVSIFCVAFAVIWFLVLFASGRVIGGEK